MKIIDSSLDFLLSCKFALAPRLVCRLDPAVGSWMVHRVYNVVPRLEKLLRVLYSSPLAAQPAPHGLARLPKSHAQ